MIPMNRLSTEPNPAEFMSPDDLENTDYPLVDYELGGVALSDASNGLQDRVWTVRADPITGGVYLSAPEHVESLFLSLPGITEVSLAFDQNMKPALAYVQDGTAKFRWYNSLTDQYVVETLPTGTITPRVCLDDKRSNQTIQGNNDIILAYVRNGDLYYRQQRNRYENEYLLKAGVNAKLIRVGMNMLNRLQFLLEAVN